MKSQANIYTKLKRLVEFALHPEAAGKNPTLVDICTFALDAARLIASENFQALMIGTDFEDTVDILADYDFDSAENQLYEGLSLCDEDTDCIQEDYEDDDDDDVDEEEEYIGYWD